MLKGYEVLDKIPAYDLKGVCRNADFYKRGINETLEEYKENTVGKYDKEEIIKEINYMIDHYEFEENALFVLNVILNDENLLNKTRICTDGSFRNIRVYNFNNCGKRTLECDESLHYCNCKNCPKRNNVVTLDINWKNVIEGKINSECGEWGNFRESIKQKDIIKVLNNIEEIFIQL